jgi:YD repeat-containing protein
MRGRPWKAYDSSGRSTVVAYDFKGQPLSSEKQIRTEYKTEADWPDAEADREALLETEVFTTSTTYDALGRAVQQTNPDTSITRPEYLESGKLDKVRVTLKGETAETDFVTGITYNAKGQREQITYGNGTKTVYAYDDATFRLTSLVTTRTSDSKVLQDIAYIYDPVGNIVKITDVSHERVFTTTGPVEAAQTYTYDALYRLIDATGREHTALTDTPFFNDPNQFKQSRHTLLNDMTQLANYTRQYTYDDAGNLTTIQHLGTNPFTRNIDVDTATNRGLLRGDSRITSNFSEG